MTGAEHQAHFAVLNAQGYRPISISVYGDPGDPRYAAIWARRGGPAWRAIHGVDAAGYQEFHETWAAEGFVPTLVSVTGTAGDAVFAGVVEAGFEGSWEAHHGLISGSPDDSATFENRNKVAKEERSFSYDPSRSTALQPIVASRRSGMAIPAT